MAKRTADGKNTRSANWKGSGWIKKEVRLAIYATGGALERIEIQRWLPLNIELAKALIKGETGKFDN